MIYDVSSNISPSVDSDGIISFQFPRMEKVVWAGVTYDNSVNVTGDMSGSIDISTNFGTDASANNHVNIYPFINTGGNNVRRAAVTADLTGHKFCVIAFGY